MKRVKLLVLLVACVSIVFAKDEVDPGFGNDGGGTRTVCIGDVGKNTGVCKKRSDNCGSFCAESSCYETNNCYGQTTVK